MTGTTPTATAGTTSMGTTVATSTEATATTGSVRGKVVAVTGGGRGIGAALCRAFAAEGAALVACLDVDGSNAAHVADEIGGLGLQVDVTDESAIVSAVDTIVTSAGLPDLWVSNAGIVFAGGVELSDDDWRQMIDVNLMAHVWAARALVPRWLERGSGHLLTVASAAGLLTQIGSAPYSVTKHAAVALSEWIAITYGARGIDVSILCPQAVNTAMIAGIAGGGVAGVDGVMEPEEVARAAVQGLRDGTIRILPHPEVAEYERRRAEDPDRWIRGMQRLQSRFDGFARATAADSGSRGT